MVLSHYVCYTFTIIRGSPHVCYESLYVFEDAESDAFFMDMDSY